MLVLAGLTAVFKTIQMIFFAYVGENITLNTRKNFYETIIRRQISWHDYKANSTGVISSTLSSDC